MAYSQNLSVRRLTPAIGAVVTGVDLSRPIDDGVIAEIKSALLRHQVIFFEDQDLKPAAQRDFAARFGPLQSIATGAVGSSDGQRVPEIMLVDNHPGNPTRSDHWHSDMTFLDAPPLGTILHAKTLPPVGGDTIWSSMTAAYAALSRPFQAFLAGLTAEHDYLPPSSRRHRAGADTGEGRRANGLRETPPAQHPVVRTHPETGAPAIYVNSSFTTRILGLSADESHAILDFLAQHIQQPEFTVRWHWSPGSVAFWDSRCTQHRAISDYFPHHRIMQRAAILGDRPIYRISDAKTPSSDQMT